jgi:hypothetical protein
VLPFAPSLQQPITSGLASRDTPPRIFEIELNFLPIRDDPRSRFFTRKPTYRQPLIVGESQTTKDDTPETQVLTAVVNFTDPQNVER